MSSIRCPECKLINTHDARRCRRCNAPLSADRRGDVPGTAALKFNSAVRRVAVPAIVIVSVLGIYGFYRHSKAVSSPRPRPAAAERKTVKQAVKAAPVKNEVVRVQKIYSDFMARFDQNAADPNGDALLKNQALAAETMTVLKEQQKRLVEPAARQYVEEFYGRLERYHELLVRFNIETGRLSEVRQRVKTEISEIREDSTLSEKDKNSRQIEILTQLENESQGSNAIAQNMDQAMKSLRALTIDE